MMFLISFNALLFTYEAISKQAHSDKTFTLCDNYKREILSWIFTFTIYKVMFFFNYYAKRFDALLIDVHHYISLGRYLNFILKTFYSKLFVCSREISPPHPPPPLIFPRGVGG